MKTFKEQALELARRESNYGMDEPTSYSYAERIAEQTADLYEPVVANLVAHFDCHATCPEGRKALRAAQEALDGHP